MVIGVVVLRLLGQGGAVTSVPAASRTPALAAVPVPDDPGAVVSVWCGVPGVVPAFARAEDVEHYGASMIKIAVMLALYAAAERGELDLDELVPVTDRFPSLSGGEFRADQGYDNDDEPWRLLGRPASLRWLCHRMIVSSSNLASNLLVQRLGLEAVNRECPPGMRVGRQIGDAVARAAGITNTTSAAAGAALLARVVRAALGESGTGREMLRTLGEDEHRDGIPAALPSGVWVGNKPGWVEGTRHDCAVVVGPGEPPYLLSVCTTGLSDERALDVIRRYAAASWQDRAQITAAASTVLSPGAAS